jgi:hypothetical protein
VRSAARYKKLIADTLRALLAARADAGSTQGRYGQLPLHVLCRNEAVTAE